MDRGSCGVFLLLLFIPAGLPFFFGCDKTGPEDCDFEYYDRDEREYKYTFCSWESDGAFKAYFFRSDPKDFFVGLDSTKHFAHFTSKEACSTEGETYCLRFKYQVIVDDTDLSVSIKYEGSEEAETPIWIVSSSSGWDRARVPITTDRDFSVVFKARRRSTVPTTLEPVFIDEIKYEKRDCSLSPRGAAPPPVTTTPTTSPSTTTTTPTTPTTTHSTRSTMVPETATSEVSSSITTVKTTNTTKNLTESESHQDKHSSEQSNKIKLIVGVTVAVVIIAIFLLLLVFLRRKLLEPCKRRFISEQSKRREDNPHNGVSPEESHYANAAVLDHAQSSPQHPFNTRTSAETSDYYSVVSSQDEMQLPSEPEAAQYAVVNKSGKGTQSGSSKSHGKTITTADATTDESHYYSTATEAEYNNIPFHTERQNGDASSSSSTKPATNNSNTAVYHVLEEQRANKDSSVYSGQKEGQATATNSQRDVYNSLDFEGKGLNTARTGDDFGTVYSHLNEGAEGTYNEVDRQKRAEIIDSEYSHIP